MERLPEHNRESGYLEGKRYDVEKLYAFVEHLPTEEAPTERFRYVISPKNETVFGIDDKFISPYELVRDWDTLLTDPSWKAHVASIQSADLEKPILVSHNGHVVDGQHRVIRAFLESAPTIKIKHLPENLPDSLGY